MMKDLTIDKEVFSQFPLVSVVVVTYNSSATVIETLESIKAQTYDNIELIITDDCSPDNTVKICKDWLVANKSRFVYTELVTTDHNTGVSGNVNRGILCSHGYWIKCVAGDDMLFPTSIDEYLHFVREISEDITICISDVVPFSTDGEVPLSVLKFWSQCFKYVQEPYNMQWRRICRELFVVGPGSFFKRDLFDSVGGFSEEYDLGEEWPFYYKVLKTGNRLYAIDKKLVKYRVSSSSLCHSKDSNGLGNYRLFESSYRFFFDFPYHDLLKDRRYIEVFHFSLMYKIKMYQFKSNNCLISRFLAKIFKYISPYGYLKLLNLIN